MAKAELKTKETNLEVGKFIDSVKDENQKEDSKVILKLMEKVTGSKPKMWGSSIVGFGNVQLKYASGRELDWFRMGFSPRKQSLTLYVLNGYSDKYSDLLEKLGKHTTGKGCLYIKKLSDVKLDILEEIIKRSNKNIG